MERGSRISVGSISQQVGLLLVPASSRDRKLQHKSRNLLTVQNIQQLIYQHYNNSMYSLYMCCTQESVYSSLNIFLVQYKVNLLNSTSCQRGSPMFIVSSQNTKFYTSLSPTEICNHSLTVDYGPNLFPFVLAAVCCKRYQLTETKPGCML